MPEYVFENQDKSHPIKKLFIPISKELDELENLSYQTSDKGPQQGLASKDLIKQWYKDNIFPAPGQNFFLNTILRAHYPFLKDYHQELLEIQNPNSKLLNAHWKQETLDRYKPDHVWFHPEEDSFPIKADEYVDECSLQIGETVVVQQGQLTMKALLSKTADQWRAEYPNAKGDLMLVIPEKYQKGNRNLSTDCLYGDIYEDTIVLPDGSVQEVYGIPYIFNYARNDPKFCGCFGFHTDDIEHVTILVKKQANGEAGNILRIYFAAHGSLDGLWLDPSKVEFTKDEQGNHTNHCVVYSAKGSHASYPNKGFSSFWQNIKKTWNKLMCCHPCMTNVHSELGYWYRIAVLTDKTGQGIKWKTNTVSQNLGIFLYPGLDGGTGNDHEGHVGTYKSYLKSGDYITNSGHDEAVSTTFCGRLFCCLANNPLSCCFKVDHVKYQAIELQGTNKQEKRNVDQTTKLLG